MVKQQKDILRRSSRKRSGTPMGADAHIAFIFDLDPGSTAKIERVIWESLEADQSFVPLFFSSNDFPIRGEQNLDGAIMWANSISDWPTSLLNHNIPKIHCGYGVSKHPQVRSVAVDVQSLVQSAFQHLGDLGIESIHFLASSDASHELYNATTTISQKSEILSDFFRLEGHSPRMTHERLISLRRESHLHKMLFTKDKPFGLICEDCQSALLAARAMEGLQIAIPQDVAIMALDENPYAKMASPEITTIDSNSEAVALESIQLMKNLLKGKATKNWDVRISPSEVFVRESTCPENSEPIVERLLRQIKQHACEGITVSELSERNGISRKTLIKKFIDHTGSTPSQAIREERINMAKKLLDDGGYNYSEIAHLTGFTSLSSFTNFFVRHTGSAPSQHCTKKSHSGRK